MFRAPKKLGDHRPVDGAIVDRQNVEHPLRFSALTLTPSRRRHHHPTL